MRLERMGEPARSPKITSGTKTMENSPKYRKLVQFETRSEGRKDFFGERNGKEVYQSNMTSTEGHEKGPLPMWADPRRSGTTPHATSVPPRTRRRTRRTLCSNGVPKRGPPAESGTGEPLGPWPAPIAKQTAQLPRSTFHPSQSPQPRACNAWTSPIRGGLLVPLGCQKNCPVNVSGMRLWFAGTPQHAPQCDVHRKLGPTETWQILGQNLNAALVIGRNTHIHVPEKRVVSDTRTRLPADSGQHALSGSGTFLESPRRGASGEVVSLQIKKFVAPAASSLGDRQWKGQSLQQATPGRGVEEQCTRVPWVRGTRQCQHCAPNATSSEHGAKRDGQSTLRSSL